MKLKILLVDSEMLFTKIIKNILLIKEYEIEEAGNGYEGLQKAKNKHFDLVISNVFLTQVSGLEFINRYKNEVNNTTPIFVISKSSDKNLESAVFDLGAANFITIPMNLYKLFKKVKELETDRKAFLINQ
ncbi:PleD family two-component system response regulator [Epilithonimonas sp.]|uniref:response regulator n=1 Tax=Epilithonimonas sp. TaxID=2894511 RepID=UPI0035B1A6C5